MTDTDHVNNAYNRIAEEVSDFSVPPAKDYLPIEKNTVSPGYVLRLTSWGTGPKTIDHIRSILSDFEMELVNWHIYPISHREMIVKLYIILH